MLRSTYSLFSACLLKQISDRWASDVHTKAENVEEEKYGKITHEMWKEQIREL